MKKKKIRNVFFMILLLTLVFTAGCGERSKEALENELAYRQLGITKMSEGAYEEAVKMFQKALDQSLALIGELEIDICYYKAAAQYKGGDVEGALETYTALINYDKKNADALYLRGTLYLVEGQSELALEDYEAALGNGLNNTALYNKIATNLINAGFSEAAETVLKRGLDIKGEEAENYREKGYTYFLLGEYSNARTYLDKAVNMKDTEAIFYLAKLCEAEGNMERATQLYESYVASHGDDTETLNALGLARFAEGNYEQALTFFQQALESPEPANQQELRRNEIAALEFLRDFKTAREKMETYLADYPEDEAAVREYEFLKSR